MSDIPIPPPAVPDGWDRFGRGIASTGRWITSFTEVTIGGGCRKVGGGFVAAMRWLWSSLFYVIVLATCGLLWLQFGPQLPLPIWHWPTPGPVPTPLPVPPSPNPSPAPIAGDGVRVLIVYDSSDPTKLTKDAQAVIFGKSFRDFLNATCVVGADGKTKEYRIFDKDVTGESKTWADAMSRPHPTLPWLLVSNGKAGFEGPVTNEADATKIITGLKGK